MMHRIERLRAVMKQNGLDAVLATGRTAVRYLSGFTSDECVVLVTNQDCMLFTDFRYTIQAKEQAPEYQICEITQTTMLDKVAEALSDCKTCGFEDQVMPVATYASYQAKLPVTFVPFSDAIAKLRLVKTADEVECLQAAQRIADKAYTEFLTRVHSGMTEREAVAELNYICERLGSEGASFDPIIGSGPNGAMCHAIPGMRKLQRGDMVVVDFGCIYGGYHSDMTRTFGVIDVSDELRRVYDIVLHAQLASLDALKAGISGKALDAVARDIITGAGYGACFGHSLGHGVGLEIHEQPRASTISTDVLEAGMTITVEPGIYVEGKGGVRIEDCCVVTETGKINLVSSPKELLMIS